MLNSLAQEYSSKLYKFGSEVILTCQKNTVVLVKAAEAGGSARGHGRAILKSNFASAWRVCAPVRSLVKPSEESNLEVDKLTTRAYVFGLRSDQGMVYPELLLSPQGQ